MSKSDLAKLREEIEAMSDNQLMNRAAHYNALLRRGRRLVEEGQALISANINLFVACQNELHSRTLSKIERETDREAEGP
jgi:hypothetical protein